MGDLNFFDASNSTQIVETLDRVYRVEQMENLRARMCLSAVAMEFIPSQGRNPNEYYHCFVLGEPTVSESMAGVNIKAHCCAYENIIRRTCRVSILTIDGHRREGYGDMMLASSLYFLLAVKGMESVIAEVCSCDVIGNKIANKFMNPSGFLPRTWLWYGARARSNLYSLTLPDILMGSYNEIAATILKGKIDGLGFQTLNELEAKHSGLSG